MRCQSARMNSLDPFARSFDSIEIDRKTAPSADVLDLAIDAVARPSTPITDQPGFYLIDDADGRFEIDRDWGEPDLTPAERVIAGNTLEVLAMVSGNPQQPVNAIPPSARATLHMRHAVGTAACRDAATLQETIRTHLAEHGFADVEVGAPALTAATRLDPDNPWVRWALASIEHTTAKAPVLLPNLGGSLPNDVFADILGLPTLWVPHSYPACSQHAPDEHLLVPVAREALEIMTGLFWDLAEQAATLPRRVR